MNAGPLEHRGWPAMLSHCGDPRHQNARLQYNGDDTDDEHMELKVLYDLAPGTPLYIDYGPSRCESSCGRVPDDARAMDVLICWALGSGLFRSFQFLIKQHINRKRTRNTGVRVRMQSNKLIPPARLAYLYCEMSLKSVSPVGGSGIVGSLCCNTGIGCFGPMVLCGGQYRPQ